MQLYNLGGGCLSLKNVCMHALLARLWLSCIGQMHVLSVLFWSFLCYDIHLSIFCSWLYNLFADNIADSLKGSLQSQVSTNAMTMMMFACVWWSCIICVCVCLCVSLGDKWMFVDCCFLKASIIIISCSYSKSPKLENGDHNLTNGSMALNEINIFGSGMKIRNFFFILSMLRGNDSLFLAVSRGCEGD